MIILRELTTCSKATMPLERSGFEAGESRRGQGETNPPVWEGGSEDPGSLLRLETLRSTSFGYGVDYKGIISEPCTNYIGVICESYINYQGVIHDILYGIVKGRATAPESARLQVYGDPHKATDTFQSGNFSGHHSADGKLRQCTQSQAPRAEGDHTADGKLRLCSQNASTKG